MELLESDKLKIRILRCLDKQNGAVSLNSLKKKVGALNYRSVRRNCEFLALVDLLIIKKQKIEEVNYNMISISKKGKEFTKKLDEMNFDLKHLDSINHYD